MTPAKGRLSAAEEQALQRCRQFEIGVRDKKVRCYQWGRGPAVLLVHGWNGRAAQLSHFIDPLRRAGYSTLALDAPAHGESDGTRTNGFEFTDAVRALLRTPEGREVRGVIAHSLGGFAAVNAISREGLSAALVLVAPALQMKRILCRSFDLHGIPPRVYHGLLSDLEQRYGYDLERDDAARRLREIAGSVLILHDRDDQVIPYAHSREVADLLPAIQLVTTERLGHKRVLKDPGSVRRILAHLSAAAAGGTERAQVAASLRPAQ
jgi:pimeloyl-ACP methyl ester carboxylesterase